LFLLKGARRKQSFFLNGSAVKRESHTPRGGGGLTLRNKYLFILFCFILSFKNKTFFSQLSPLKFLLSVYIFTSLQLLQHLQNNTALQKLGREKNWYKFVSGYDIRF